jgi:hypothetical protein
MMVRDGIKPAESARKGRELYQTASHRMELHETAWHGMGLQATMEENILRETILLQIFLCKNLLLLFV